MSHIFTLDHLEWGATFFLHAALILLLIYRRNHRVFPLFFLFILLDFLRGVVLFEIYQIWGFHSMISFKVAWGTRGLVAVTRALAVVEICRRVLAKYPGIWALGKQILLAMAALVLVCSWAISQHGWYFFAVNADRGFHLAIAAAILTLFLFMGYFEAPIEPAARFLAIGFFLYSCFNALNDTILERWLTSYAAQWNLLGTVIFLTSLLLWSWPLRNRQPSATFKPALLPGDAYGSLSPQINSHLRALNEQLSHFWHLEGKKT